MRIPKHFECSPFSYLAQKCETPEPVRPRYRPLVEDRFPSIRLTPTQARTSLPTTFITTQEQAQALEDRKDERTRKRWFWLAETLDSPEPRPASLMASSKPRKERNEPKDHVKKKSRGSSKKLNLNRLLDDHLLHGSLSMIQDRDFSFPPSNEVMSKTRPPAVETVGLYPPQAEKGSKGKAKGEMMPSPGKGHPPHEMAWFYPVDPLMPYDPLMSLPMPYPVATPKPPSLHPSTGWVPQSAMPYPTFPGCTDQLPRKGKGKGDLPDGRNASAMPYPMSPGLMDQLKRKGKGKGLPDGRRASTRSSATDDARAAREGGRTPASTTRNVRNGPMMARDAPPSSPAPHEQVADATDDLLLTEQVDQALKAFSYVVAGANSS
jgi:hypothetical protein